MKLKFYLACLVLSSPLLSKAQITVNQSDFPSPGTLWVEFADNRQGVHTITAPGASQSWNYANAFVVDDTTVLNFISPGATPSNWATNYPTSTCATYSAIDTTAQFFKSQANGFYTDGLYTGSLSTNVNVLDYNPNQLIVPAQFTYNSTRANTFLLVLDQPANPPTPAFRIKLYGIQNFTGDAYGSLVTPTGSYPNTLRIKNQQYTIDSTFIDFNGTGTYTFLNTGGPSDTTITYSWIKNGVGALLMTIDQDPLSLLSTGATYYSLTPVGLPENNGISLKNTLVYPNPVSGTTVNFDMDNVAAEKLRIFNVTGQLVREESVSGINHLTLSTSSLRGGVYTYELINDQNTRVSQGRFIVVK